MLVETPADALLKKTFDDQGANKLYYGPNKFDELHAYWDTELVKIVTDHTTSATTLADKLKNNLDSIDASTGGDLHTWPERAGESAKLADGAYQRIKLGAQPCPIMGHLSKKSRSRSRHTTMRFKRPLSLVSSRKRHCAWQNC